MIISKIYNKLSKEKQEEFVVGLVLGLVGGLVGGLVLGLVGGLVVGLVGVLVGVLVWGLVWGLVGGLVLGLVGGLVGGLAGGLVVGLVWGLVVVLVNFKEALPFISGFYEIGLIILGIIIISEILFWLMDKEKVKKKKVFWYTCKKKIECIFETLLGLSVIPQIYIFTREIAKHYKEVLEIMLQWIGYIGLGVLGIGVIVLIFYIWIKLNSLKYD